MTKLNSNGRMTALIHGFESLLPIEDAGYMERCLHMMFGFLTYLETTPRKMVATLNQCKRRDDLKGPALEALRIHWEIFSSMVLLEDCRIRSREGARAERREAEGKISQLEARMAACTVRLKGLGYA